MLPQLSLLPVSREDVQRIAQWLQDEEVCASWYGRNEKGEPLHIGYSPKEMLEAMPEEWNTVFASQERRISSVYTAEGGHIGETQMEIDEALKNAQLFVLIGKKELWGHHYGSAAMLQLLDMVFNVFRLHRAWVEVPEYNLPALRMAEHIGFVLEGRMRGSRPKEGKWYNSLIMGLLAEEYARRKVSGHLKGR